MAGGVTVMITPDGFIGFSQAGMLSPEGKCKAFDASANGFVRGEGAGMVLLKKLSEAIADGDPIHAVIIGSAVNQDGHTNGISLPSPEAQARLVRDACADAGIDPTHPEQSAAGLVENLELELVGNDAEPVERAEQSEDLDLRLGLAPVLPLAPLLLCLLFYSSNPLGVVARQVLLCVCMCL